jgi:Uma2 family endonuclease
MATAVEPRSKTHTPESRFVIHDLGWQGYETLLKLIGDRPIRLTYDRGSVEFMTLSQDHEQFGLLLGRIIETVTEELDLPCIGVGSTTWRREDVDRGLEADRCYYLANAERICGKTIDLSVDPPPDLAVEVEISRSALDRMGIYAALRVPEVWRYDGKTLWVGRLQEDQTYAPSTVSLSFPFLPLDEIVRFVQQGESMDHTAWGRQFRAWARNELVPRLGRGQGNDEARREQP